VETKLSQLTTDFKQLHADMNSNGRIVERSEQIVAQLQTDIDRLRQQLQRHERNKAMHSHGEERNQPMGFQENDQPSRFLGR
jgi:chromosome segregation ATPase